MPHSNYIISAGLISTTINCSHLDFLPFNQQLVPIVKFHSITGAPLARSYQQLEKWFWRTSFSDRFSSGTTTQKMNVDIQTMIGIREDKIISTKYYHISTTEQELVQTKFSKGNPITRAFLLLMSTQQPLDLISNTNVDLKSALSKYNRKEYHHVFPRAYLKGRGINDTAINSVVNFCFLSSQSNKKISDKKPSEYIFELVDEVERTQILKSNILPTDTRVFEKNSYMKFLEERVTLVMDIVNTKT